MFVSFWMTQRLTREVNELQKRLTDKHIELGHYQKYAGRLGGSANMNISQIAGLSSSLTGRASLFSQYADQASSMSAMQNLQMMKMMGRVPITGNQMTQMQLEMSAYNNFKQEALKALKQQEIQVLNEKEKEIQLEINEIQQQLSMKEAELKSYKELAKSEAKEAAPDFG